MKSILEELLILNIVAINTFYSATFYFFNA